MHFARQSANARRELEGQSVPELERGWVRGSGNSSRIYIPHKEVEGSTSREATYACDNPMRIAEEDVLEPRGNERCAWANQISRDPLDGSKCNANAARGGGRPRRHLVWSCLLSSAHGPIFIEYSTTPWPRHCSVLTERDDGTDLCIRRKSLRRWDYGDK